MSAHLLMVGYFMVNWHLINILAPWRWSSRRKYPHHRQLGAAE